VPADWPPGAPYTRPTQRSVSGGRGSKDDVIGATPRQE